MTSKLGPNARTDEQCNQPSARHNPRAGATLWITSTPFNLNLLGRSDHPVCMRARLFQKPSVPQVAGLAIKVDSSSNCRGMPREARHAPHLKKPAHVCLHNLWSDMHVSLPLKGAYFCTCPFQTHLFLPSPSGLQCEGSAQISPGCMRLDHVSLPLSAGARCQRRRWACLWPTSHLTSGVL